jgi:hypothetical protein
MTDCVQGGRTDCVQQTAVHGRGQSFSGALPRTIRGTRARSKALIRTWCVLARRSR